MGKHLILISIYRLLLCIISLCYSIQSLYSAVYMDVYPTPQLPMLLGTLVTAGSTSSSTNQEPLLTSSSSRSLTSLYRQTSPVLMDVSTPGLVTLSQLSIVLRSLLMLVMKLSISIFCPNLLVISD